MTISVREKIAAVQHAIWSHWMKYLFSQCLSVIDGGNMIIPADKARRWKRQMNTPYSELTEKERDSDREQVDKVLSEVSLLDLMNALIS